MRTAYHIATAIVGLSVVSAISYVWVFGTVEWPITFLAFGVAALWTRQECYAEILKRTLLGQAS